MRKQTAGCLQTAVCLRISAHRAKARDEQAEACEYARRKARNGKSADAVADGFVVTGTPNAEGYYTLE
ncbi:MAG: hypothetical protein IKI88_06985, partial [Anaerotignum sp.]|nr:hypothetical protein [Anaerotignum sp.]